MSFVIAQPDFVTAAAENIASIRSALTEAASAASGPTSALAAAGADEVSAAIAQVFGTYGQEFQALNTQAAAFHAAFGNLLNRAGAAYLSTELANAQQALQSMLSAPSGAAPAAPLLPGLPDLPIGGGNAGGIPGLPGLPALPGIPTFPPLTFPALPGLASLTDAGAALGSAFGSLGQAGGAFVSALIAGNPLGFLTNLLFPPGPAPTGPQLNAWQKLYIHTNQNLVLLNEAWARDPNPIGGAITHNWQGYAYETGRDWQLALNNLPFALQHMPETLQTGAAGLASFDAAKYLRISADGTTGALNTLNTSFGKFNADLNANLPEFSSNWAKVNYDIGTGQYNAAVRDGTSAFINLFINGFDTSNLNDIKLEGPIADLFPALALPGQQLHGMSTLMTGGSVGQRMVANAGNFFTALSDTTVSAGIGVTIEPTLPVPTVALQLNAFFGLPLALGFGLGGAPVAMLDGLATSGTIIGAGMLTGNPSQVFGGINDIPAYMLDGLLNGEVIVDMPLPITVAVPAIGDVTIPVTAHLPFDGMLVPPHALSATVPVEVTVPVLGIPVNVPIELTFGGTKFGGIASLLTNSGFRILADAITN